MSKARMTKQSLINWFLTLIALAAILFPPASNAELRAFRLVIRDQNGGTERRVVSRFDHIQYPMYHYVKKTELVEIEQTWMCWTRNDYVGALCPAPAPAEGQVATTDPKP